MIEKKIKKRTAVIGVIGLGYVGLPLQLLFAKNDFKTIGLDRKKDRVDKINIGESYIEDVESSELKIHVKDGRIRATVDYDELKQCDVVQICVPTPIDANRVTVLKYIVYVSEKLKDVLHKDELVILKSTTFPETTEKVVLPILEKSGLRVCKDFYLAFSPERIDPGNKRYTVENTPVVVGGVTEKCTELAKLLYKSVIDNVVTVSSPRAAELTKLLENTFRNVNIAMVNEFALLCERMKIDIWEVIEAASSKPFGFMPFYPGPGVGGHCIPIDPYYLSYKAKEYNFHINFIELSGEINERMPYYIVDKVIKTLSQNGICASKARIFVLGAAFKRDIGDMRDSPAIRIMEIMYDKVKDIVYNDPFIDKIEINETEYTSVPITKESLKSVDCALILTDHSGYDYNFIVNNSEIVIDTRNATKGVEEGKEKIIKLGT